jgi:hypothetical protein
MNFWCRIGLHKTRVYERNGEPLGHYIQVGRTYVEKCQRCGAKERSFVLTRDMI